jgi:general L-amino acid transport system substrate-binding protein
MKRVSLVLTLALPPVSRPRPPRRKPSRRSRTAACCPAASARACRASRRPDDKGNWTGLDVDVCRAIAAAIFNDPTKVKFVPLSAKDRFTALQSGEIDVLSRNTTWTLSRDTSLGANFTGVTYYDGQGFW